MPADGEGPLWETLPCGEMWVSLSQLRHRPSENTQWTRVSGDWRMGAPCDPASASPGGTLHPYYPHLLLTKWPEASETPHVEPWVSWCRPLASDDYQTEPSAPKAPHSPSQPTSPPGARNVHGVTMPTLPRADPPTRRCTLGCPAPRLWAGEATGKGLGIPMFPDAFPVRPPFSKPHSKTRPT